MTLILSARTGAFVTQSSDCRVSWRRGSAQGIHSDVENKAIIVWADDGMAVLGYTGEAYIAKIPTDEWLVKSITGIDMRGNALYQQKGYIHRRNLGSIFEKIRTDIDVVARNRNGFHLEVLASGFKQRRRYLGGFTVAFGYRAGQLLMPGPQRPPRSKAEAIGLVWRMVGDPPDAATMMARLPALLPSYPKNAEILANAMTRLIRERAQVALGVGSNTMAISMDGILRTIIHRVDLGDNLIALDHPPLTPWICGRTTITAPGPAVGLDISCDGWKISSVSIPKPASADGPAWEFVASPRKSPPR